jgi:hypothetical protein
MVRCKIKIATIFMTHSLLLPFGDRNIDPRDWSLNTKQQPIILDF